MNSNRKIKIFQVALMMHFFVAGFYSHAQPGNTSQLVNRFDAHSLQHFQEKIFVHTDKSFYVTGEIVWFKLYATDAHLNQPLDISKVAYVELYSREKKPVLQAKIELNEGTGSGSFMLPFSLSSDAYILRAYTNWMKNFSADYFFETTLTIVNPLKKMAAAANKYTASFDIQFFPEGGNLVTGQPAKVAFHAVDQSGKGINCKGVIVDQNNDSLASFHTQRFGMGSFEFTPLAGNTYRAIVHTGTGHSITRSLPAPYEKGYSMKLTTPGKDKIKVTVKIKNVNDENLFLLVHTRQAARIAKSQSVKDGTVEFDINKNELGEGISHFTIFNERRQPVCERLFFVRPAQHLGLELSTDRPTYSLRQETSIKIGAQGNKPGVSNLSLSLSVFQIDSLQSLPGADIESYLWLTSDLSGTIESPSYYFSAPEAEAAEPIDNLMLTHGWSRFKWEDVLAESKPLLEFLPEYEGMLVSGKLIEKITGTGVKNIPAYLSVTGERFIFKSSNSDEKGNIFFGLNRFYGNNEIIVQAHGKAANAYTISVTSPFSENYSGVKYPPLPALENWRDHLLSRSIATQVENTFVQEDRQRFSLPSLPDTTPFFGNNGKTYLLDDYTRFITMEEVLREYVAEVRVRKQQEKFSYKVKNSAYQDFFENDPLVLLDGVPVFDITKLMAYDPLKIRKLDVVTQKYFSGTEVFEGIVSYDTYKGNLDGFELDPGALMLEYQGLQPHREFYSPQYASKEQLENRTPDFRNVLYWAPDIKTTGDENATVSFYTSDRPGKYAAVVQGIGGNGICGSKTIFFTVVK